MSDLTDRDTIHTAEREAEEEIGLKLEHYLTLGCLPPVTDSRAIMITPVVALLNSPKFVDFRLALDETTDAFYLDLKQFLYSKNNYKMLEVGDHFVTHHFDIERNHIWGVAAFELIVIASLVFQQLPEFPFFRHGQQIDLKLFTQQLKTHFQLCVNYQKKAQLKEELDEISRLS
jgi:8-oxo-dGTP pyrophosphatase MutT (NUDIX family)